MHRAPMWRRELFVCTCEAIMKSNEPEFQRALLKLIADLKECGAAPILTLSEAATLCRMHYQTFWRKVRQNRVATHRAGRRRVVRREDLAAYIVDGRPRA